MAEGFITRRFTPIPDPFDVFKDKSGSPGTDFPINDLDGNIMADLDKGIAYYGTVPHTDLYTADGLSSEIGLTEGNSTGYVQENVWYKYYWNGGIHFWRPGIRRCGWFDLQNRGAIYGTGTTTSRKGHNGVENVAQDREVTKNGVTYIVRTLEGSSVDPTDVGSDLHGSEIWQILGNLHAATNSGEYSNSPTDGVSYNNWITTSNFTNDDFVGWKTNFNDNTFNVSTPGASSIKFKFTQETSSNNNQNYLLWGDGSNNPNFSTFSVSSSKSSSQSDGRSWQPVLTVKHPSFATYGKTGGFNQNEPDF